MVWNPWNWIFLASWSQLFKIFRSLWGRGQLRKTSNMAETLWGIHRPTSTTLHSGTCRNDASAHTILRCGHFPELIVSGSAPSLFDSFHPHPQQLLAPIHNLGGNGSIYYTGRSLCVPHHCSAPWNHVSTVCIWYLYDAKFSCNLHTFCSLNKALCLEKF
jgi:hypothetical protein